MDPAALALAAATTLAQFGATAPALSAAGAPTPYGVLGCQSRARTALYVNGGTNVLEKGNSLFAILGGDTTVMAWCRGDHVIIVGAGPHAEAGTAAIKGAF